MKRVLCLVHFSVPVYFVALLCFVLPFCSCGVALGADTTKLIEVTGTGSGLSESDAVHNAVEDAIRRVAPTLFSSESTLVEQELTSRYVEYSRSNIKRQEVVSSTPLGHGGLKTHSVSVKVVIDPMILGELKTTIEKEIAGGLVSYSAEGRGIDEKSARADARFQAMRKAANEHVQKHSIRVSDEIMQKIITRLNGRSFKMEFLPVDDNDSGLLHSDRLHHARIRIWAPKNVIAQDVREFTRPKQVLPFDPNKTWKARDNELTRMDAIDPVPHVKAMNTQAAGEAILNLFKEFDPLSCVRLYLDDYSRINPKETNLTQFGELYHRPNNYYRGTGDFIFDTKRYYDEFVPMAKRIFGMISTDGGKLHEYGRSHRLEIDKIFSSETATFRDYKRFRPREASSPYYVSAYLQYVEGADVYLPILDDNGNPALMTYQLPKEVREYLNEHIHSLPKPPLRTLTISINMTIARSDNDEVLYTGKAVPRSIFNFKVNALGRIVYPDLAKYVDTLRDKEDVLIREGKATIGKRFRLHPFGTLPVVWKSVEKGAVWSNPNLSGTIAPYYQPLDMRIESVISEEISSDGRNALFYEFSWKGNRSVQRDSGHGMGSLGSLDSIEVDAFSFHNAVTKGMLHPVGSDYLLAFYPSLNNILVSMGGGGAFVYREALRHPLEIEFKVPKRVLADGEGGFKVTFNLEESQWKEESSSFQDDDDTGDYDDDDFDYGDDEEDDDDEF